MAALAAAAVAAVTITPEKAITHDDLLLPRKVLRMTSAAYGGDRYRRCVLRWTSRSGEEPSTASMGGPCSLPVTSVAWYGYVVASIHVSPLRSGT